MRNSECGMRNLKTLKKANLKLGTLPKRFHGLPWRNSGAEKRKKNPAISYFQKIDDPLCECGFEKDENIEALAKLFKVSRNRHSGQAKRDPESRIFKRFWIPAFAGMTG